MIDDQKILDVVAEARAQRRELLPTGVLDDKVETFAAHNRNPESPCQCLNCATVRAHFNRGMVE